QRRPRRSPEWRAPGVQKAFTASLLRRRAQGVSRGAQVRGLRVDRRGDAPHLDVGFVPASLLDGFARRRHRLDAVAGVETRRVEQMLVPGTSRQTLRTRERTLGRDEL